MKLSGENNEIDDDLVNIAKYAIDGSEEDVRLFMARLVRKYKSTNPSLSERLSILLKNKPEGRNGILRDSMEKAVVGNKAYSNPAGCPAFLIGPIPYDYEVKPIIPEDLRNQFIRIIREHEESIKLIKAGLKPSSTLVFIGKPGIGKTLTAHWMAHELNLPLYTINIASIMSSYLGQTGNNLKAALDYAKSTPMVILLDEIDSLAKTRNDDTDIGEIKRVVTVLLQEIENWPLESILIAATNNPELVDQALWRRFDHVFNFQLPSKELILDAIRVFAKDDYLKFKPYEGVLAILYEGNSYSEIERSIIDLRRALTIGAGNLERLVVEVLKNYSNKHRIELAREMIKNSSLSQYKISMLTGVSRDTIRKYKGKWVLPEKEKM